MATAAGLVLGAVALLPLAFEGYQKCTNLFNCVRTFSSTFRKSSELLALQRRLFHRECRLLLRAVVSDDIAVEMIRNKDHPTWKLPSFKAHWDQHLSSDFDIPIKHVQESLNAIERLLARIGDEEACPGNSSHTPPVCSPRKYRGRSTIRKIKWAMTGKEDFQRLIDLLRQHNVDLLHSREQRSKLAKPQQQKVSQLLKPQKQVISPSSNFRNVREISKVLYEGLSATNICSCHVVNLQLDGHPQQSSGSNGQENLVQSSCFENSFRFLITKSLQTSEIHQGQCKVECTQLTVRSELQPAQACKPPKDSEDYKASISKGKSGVRFAIDEPDTKLHQEREPPDNSAFISQDEMRAINSLCSLLAQPNPLCQRPMECLGIIRSVEAFMSAATYRHLVYSGSNATPTSFQTSLEDILPKRQLFPHEERLRLAITLSYALLNFGSYETSWFRDHWRSKDVKFFLTQMTAEPDGTLSPYITPSFPSQKAIVQHSNGKAAMAVGLARNEKLFSLALILTEIGLGGKLYDIDDPTGSVRGPTDDPFVEYLKAKNIVESRILGREMGLAYAKIVKQCFFCDFGVIGEADFSEEKLQAAFYDHVVCELERCLQKFRGVI